MSEEAPISGKQGQKEKAENNNGYVHSHYRYEGIKRFRDTLDEILVTHRAGNGDQR
jgi:hypothetical protein